MAFFPDNNDVFRTQADPRFNSFAEPMNPVNMNPGPWGLDPNYLTPAYLAPYRPQYQGPVGNQFTGYNPRWGHSFNNLINPFGPNANYGGNVSAQRTPLYDSLAYRPADATASFVQNWAVPSLASIWAFHKLSGPAGKIGGAMGEGLMAGLTNGMNLSKAGTLVAGGRALGSAAGTMFLPALAAQGVVSGFDSAVMDPYVAQRQTFRSLRDNFSGVTFGDGDVGGPLTGGGLNRKTAARIAKDLSISSTRDMTFTQQETSLISDYASRAGLMDNVNPAQMGKRFEQIMKQMKVVMSVANTSDFKETIEIMAKMQMAGVNPGNLSGVMGQLAGHAAGGGFNVQKALNTVGAQGQYLFGAAGLTPYLGQTTAFGANAAFSAAFRNGMLSPALMARMGGMEGATQSATAGMLAMYQSPYSQFQAYNAYFGRGEQGSVVGNMSAFGEAVSKDPLKTIGRLRMGGDALASRHLGDEGLRGVRDRIYQVAKGIPNAIRNGKVDEGVAFMIMTDTMGIPEAQAKALLHQIGAFSSESAVNQMIKGVDRASMDSLLMYKQQEGLDKGIFTTPYNQLVKKPALFVQRQASRLVGAAQEALGGAIDSFQETWDRSVYRVKDREQRALYLEDLEQQSNNKVAGVNLSDKNAKRVLGRIQDGHAGMALENINGLAMQGNSHAKTFISSAGSEREAALKKLIETGAITGLSDKSFRNVLTAADQMGKTEKLTKDINLLDVNSDIAQEMANGFGKTMFTRGIGGDPMKAAHLKEMEKINELAKKGDKNALGFIQSGSDNDRNEFLFKLAREKKVDARYMGQDQAKGLVDMASVIGTSKDATTVELKTVKNTLGAELDKILPGKNVDDVLRYMDYMKRIDKDGVESLDSKSRKELEALVGGRLSPQELTDRAKKARLQEAKSGLMHLEGLSSKGQFGTVEGLAGYLSKKGMALLGPGVEEGMDPAAAIAQGEVQAALQKQRSDIREMAKNQRIDTSVTEGTINALDMGVAVGSFAESVQRFGEYTGALKKDSNPAGPMTVQNNSLVDMKNRAYRSK